MSKKKKDIYDIDPETAKSMLMEDDMSSFVEIVKNDIDNGNILDEYESNDDFFSNLGKMIESKHQISDYNYQEKTVNPVMSEDKNFDSIVINSVFTDKENPMLIINSHRDKGITVQFDRLISDDDDDRNVTNDYIEFINQLMNQLVTSLLPSIKPSAVLSTAEFEELISFDSCDCSSDSFRFYKYNENIVFAYALGKDFWDNIKAAAKYAAIHGIILSLIQSLYDMSKMNGVHFTYFTECDKISRMLIESDEVVNKEIFKELFTNSIKSNISSNNTELGIELFDIDIVSESIKSIVSAMRNIYEDLIGYNIEEESDDDDVEDSEIEPFLSSPSLDEAKACGWEDDESEEFNPLATLDENKEKNISNNDLEEISFTTTKKLDKEEEFLFNGQPLKLDEIPESDQDKFDSLMDDVEEDDDFYDSEKLEDEYFGNIQPKVSPIKKPANKIDNDGGMVISRRK